MASGLKWDCSAVIYSKDKRVAAEDESGGLIKEGEAGKDDSEIIQTAIDTIGAALGFAAARSSLSLQRFLLHAWNKE